MELLFICPEKHACACLCVVENYVKQTKIVKKYTYIDGCHSIDHINCWYSGYHSTLFAEKLIQSKREMNLLGVFFDCKLNWNAHVASAIRKAKKSLFALRLIKKYFSPKEIRTLLDSKFFSILYYNAVICLTPELSSAMKQELFSISANALRKCMTSYCT